ncbi:MAG: Crp/Fnr family transcriptional regulator [Anaerolineales bacterium]|jgi:CRP/FNR family cyclic AMP-dependent transcriptional regulator
MDKADNPDRLMGFQGSITMRRLSSTKETRIQALRENRYLQGLEERILAELADHTRLLSYEGEEIIFLEGQPCQGLYILDTGRVKIFKYSPAGREMIINVLDEGDTFNEVPVFDRADNPVNVAAVLDTRVWLIEAEALRGVIAQHAQAAQQIIINLSQNLRMLVGKVAELSFYPVTVRLARLLRELPPGQLAGSGSERITQDDLASRVGTVREVVARSLKELENCGAIEVERGRIRILDEAKLIDWECG